MKYFIVLIFRLRTRRRVKPVHQLWASFHDIVLEMHSTEWQSNADSNAECSRSATGEAA